MRSNNLLGPTHNIKYILDGDGDDDDDDNDDSVMMLHFLDAGGSSC